MKKSQMLSRIESVLNNLKQVGMTNKLKSSLILEEILSLGMLPPTTVRSFKSLAKETHEKVNEWENE